MTAGGGAGRPHPAAVRSHPAGSWRERAESLAFGDDALLVFGHLPPQPAGAVLICSPPLAQRPIAQPTERALATGLAAADLAVFRFHYRGEQGGPVELTLDSMRHDANQVAGWALETADVPEIAVVGVGLGAQAVAGVSLSRPTTALVLWDPVADPRRHFFDVARGEAIRRYGVVPDPGAEWSLLDQVATDMLDEEMASREMLDVCGFPLPRSLYESESGYQIASVAGHRPLPALMVEGGAGRPGLEALRARLEKAGCEGDEAATDLKAVTAGRVDHVAVESTVQWTRHRFGRSR